MSDEVLSNLMDQFTTINDNLTLFKMQINALQKVVKNVEKDVRKELKNVKNTHKPKTTRAPSGFAKPTKVSTESCEFMNKPNGSELARTEVPKALVSYIKTNKLIETGEGSKSKIVPDDKLKALLGLDDEEITDLTYFNIQKYMNKHFCSKKDNLLSNSDDGC